jgi:putative ABC transport system permease protein
MAEKRTREIGIRKVLGSPVRSIVALLCRQFLFLVIISNVIAWPVAFLVGKKWLQNFPYAVDIKLSIFIITAALTFVLALITVGYKSLKAARANPVDTLRYE